MSAWSLLFNVSCLLSPTVLAAETIELPQGIFNDPFYLLFVLIGIALLPMLAIITTSFAKIVVVLSIARQAIGTPQAPPNMVLMSLAIMFTCFSMYPVLHEIQQKCDTENISNKKTHLILQDIAHAAKEPIREFMQKHAKPDDIKLFYSLMTKEEGSKIADLTESDFIILAPAFLISELTLAFQIGFLIYLPFLVIDMTVANLLMALGMQMLAPTTISLPFKILLFVLVDGWRLLAEGLSRV